MAQHIDAEHLQQLEDLGRQLFDHALLIAPRYTLLATDTPPEANDIALRVQALVMATNGLLTAAGLTEGMTAVALGAAVGAALGMCQGDRRVLFDGFRHQMQMALREVTEAQTPQGHA